jgi:phosphatidylglycerophosphatase A
MKIRDEAIVFLATGFYIGNIPFAPGTFGTILGLPLCFLLGLLKLPLALVCTMLFILIAIWISHIAEKRLKKKDPGCIVIDEVAGMAVTLIGLPFNLTTGLSGFIIFRILDISKPFPIRALEKHLPGGLGVVADDVIAGIMANLILRVIIHII